MRLNRYYMSSKRTVLFRISEYVYHALLRQKFISDLYRKDFAQILKGVHFTCIAVKEMHRTSKIQENKERMS